MSASGQTEKNSVRAYVFRFAPELGHCSTQSACLKRADIAPIKQRYLSGSLAAVGKAAAAIECETEMRSQRSDGRVLLRIGIGIGCGNDDDPEPAAILATRRQHRRSQRIALPVAQREEKRHLSLYMGLEADVALDRVGPLRTPGLDCLLPLAAEIFLDCVAHQARLMRRFTFRLDTEPGLTLRRVANILHFACPAIAAILGRPACKANMRFATVYNAARSYNRKFGCNTRATIA